jgi:hypothetical protein
MAEATRISTIIFMVAASCWGQNTQATQDVKPPDTVEFARRALKVLQPDLELPPVREICLVEAGEADHAVFTKLAKITKYDDYLPIPSSTKKYDVVWIPKIGRQVHLMRNVNLAERKVVDVRLDDILGVIKVSGTGDVRFIIAMPAGKKPVGVYTPTAEVKKYGDLLAVPAGKYDLYARPEKGELTLLKEGMDIPAGKLVIVP